MAELDPGAGSIGIDQRAYYERYLEGTKIELKEIAMHQAELIHIGTLRGETPPEHWTGNISLKSRLETGHLSIGEVRQATSHLNESFVPVKKGASKRCVDGRTAQGYDDSNPKSYGAGLGPQVQGATYGDAIGVRLAKGYEEGATLKNDVKEYAESEKSDFAPGAHVDNHAGDGFGGCGAVVGQERKIDIYTSERKETLKKIMTESYKAGGLSIPQDKFDKLFQSGAELETHKTDYFADKMDPIKMFKNDNPRSIETQMNGHNEVSLSLNFVKDTTFHRDHYNSLTRDKIQNFNLDVWAIIEEHGEDAFYVIADAVATVLDLTDGSIQLFARVPRKNEVEPIAA